MSDLPAIDVPQRVARRFGHASAQFLADQAAVRVLHLKGPAVDPGLRPDRISTDVDVLVDPAGLSAYLAALQAAGWHRETSFATGSPFGHAATYRHPVWGYLDVHRFWPGIELDPADAFEVLWADRQSRNFAALTGQVPSRLDQRVVLCLNLARSWAGGVAPDDLRLLWSELPPDTRRRVRQRVAQLHAEVGFSVLLGELEAHRGERTYRLWRAVAYPSGRIDEWQARWYAARGPVAKATILARALVVNRQHLAAVTGHHVGLQELTAAQWRRITAAAAEMRSRARRRGGRS